MNDDVIVTSYVLIDEVMQRLGHQSHALAAVSDAEVLTVAVVAAAYFHNHHERALQVLYGMRYLSRRLSTSRFSRRLHALAGWLGLILATLGELFARGEAFLLDSLPVPVCRRARARRCGKVRGREYCGYCAAKREKFFGWRLHLVCTPAGVPVAFDLLPASEQDLNPIHELLFSLPQGAAVFADKGYVSEADAKSILSASGVRLVAIPRKNMAPLPWADDYDVRPY